MNSILRITASNGTYKEILDHTRTQYDRIYNLGGLPYGVPWPERPRDSREIRRWKPRFMFHASCFYNLPLVWLDADSMLIKDFDEMEPRTYDIALVVRPKEGKIKFKSATVFIQPTGHAHTFLRRWRETIPDNGRGDQIYLRELIGQYYPLTEHTYKTYDVLDIDGIKVKLLDRATYCWEIKKVDLIDDIPKHAKVIHFSGWSGKRKHQQKLEIFREYRERFAQV